MKLISSSEDFLVIQPNFRVNLDSVLLTSTVNNTSKSYLISGGSLIETQEGTFFETESLPTRRANVGISTQPSRVLTYAGYLIASVLLIFSLFSFGGMVKARIVLTGSMEPAISAGDIIITTPISRKEPRIGDVIAYQAKRFNGENVAVFSHRIIGGDLQNGFVVKGDANKSPDSQKPKPADILGVVIFVIPFLGNILTPKVLFLLVPCIFGLWLIMDAMKSVE